MAEDTSSPPPNTPAPDAQQGIALPTPQQTAQDYAAQKQINLMNFIPSTDTDSQEIPNTQAAAPTAQGPVNVISPSGEAQNIDSKDLPMALKQGYRVATDAEVSQNLKEQKYGTLEQQVKATAEGAASALTFGASTLAERATGLATPEDIAGREEVGPGHMIGTAAGIGLGLFTGQGEAALLEKAGAMGAKALIPGAKTMLEAADALATAKKAGQGVAAATDALRAATSATSNISRIGSAAVKGLIENVGFQAGDEASRMFAGQADPNAPVQTALADMGMAGLIGFGISGTLGSISPLWNATIGRKTTGVLSAMADKLGGIEGGVADAATRVEQQLGTELPATARAGLNYPEVKPMLETLENNTGLMAEKQQTAAIAGDGLADAFGRVGEEVKNNPVSAHEAGQDAMDAFVRARQEAIEPLAAKYEDYQKQFGGKDVMPMSETRQAQIDTAQENLLKATKARQDAESALSPGAAIEAQAKIDQHQVELTALNANATLKSPLDTAIERITNTASEKGWMSSASSPEHAAIQTALAEIPTLSKIKDVSGYIQSLRGKISEAYAGGKNVAGQALTEVKAALLEAESTSIEKEVGEKGLDAYRATKAAFAKEAAVNDDFNQFLHVPSHSVTGYAEATAERLKPEEFLRRLSGKNGAEILSVMEKHTPEVAEIVRNYHIDTLLRSGIQKAPEGVNINAPAVMKALSDFSQKQKPELAAFITKNLDQKKFSAVTSLLKAYPDLVGKSGSPKGIAHMIQDMAGSAAGVVTMLAGHNPVTAAMVGYITKVLGKDAPEAARLGMLKWLGTDKPINASGFASMVDFIHSSIKGENMLSNGVKGVFTAGREVLPQAKIDPDRREALDAKIKELQENPGQLMNADSQLGHYMPEHQASMISTAAAGTQYLSSLRPKDAKSAPFDSTPIISSVQKAQYNRALDIAEQPLKVLEAIKNGTLTAADMQHLVNLAPAIQQRMGQKLMAQAIETMSTGKQIPYQTRLGLATFFGQPLDSTMTPGAIQASQMANISSQIQQQQQQGPGPGRPKGSLKSLGKSSQMAQTPGQEGEARRGGAK